MLNNKKNKQHQGETKMKLSTGRQIERLALEHRLEFVEKSIQRIVENHSALLDGKFRHLENMRSYYKKSLKRLRAERTRIKNKLK